MDTAVRTPLEIFTLPQRLAIPHFQRAYVWEEEGQWAPLWQDVRRLAEAHLLDTSKLATHFLGAIVVQSSAAQLGLLSTFDVIDGQQRMTTMQLLFDAVAAALEERGLNELVEQLGLLTHNQQALGADSRLKLQHSNNDGASFREVMDAEPPVAYSALEHHDSKIVRAHEFFTLVAGAWLDEQPDDLATRGAALVLTLTRGLQIVVISLQAFENSQAIFETLNARGTPLTAADLIKNFVFQKLEEENPGTGHHHLPNWPFDSKFWEEQVSAGRFLVSRSSLFFNQWLISRVGEEVGPQTTFTRFKRFVDESGTTMTSLLPVIKAQADQYQRWTISAANPDQALGHVERLVYRMRANNIEVLQPVLIWLHEPGQQQSPEVVRSVLDAVESWITRRFLLRLPSGDLGRVVADVIRLHRDGSTEDLAPRISAFLSNLRASSTYWPGDEEFTTGLLTEPVYRRFPRARLRTVLEALEDEMRAESNQPPVPRRGYPIEHVLPQRWEDHWPVEGIEAEQDRAAHVHRLGNLTLLTTALNSKVSNGSWMSKRAAFQQHNALVLTSRIVGSTSEHDWDEAMIDDRTTELVERMRHIWPVPAGHKGDVADPQVKSAESIEIRDLLAQGLLQPGEQLRPPEGQWSAVRATVTVDGLLEMAGVEFETPSGAAKHLLKRNTNGWYFWRLEDQRTLRDLRLILQSGSPT